MMNYLDSKGNPLTPEQLKACFDRSQARSRERDPRLIRTRRIACGQYEVVGETGIYTVTVDTNGLHCDCVAGQNNRVCWHISGAYRARLVEKMARASAQSVNATPVRKTLEDLYNEQDARLARAGGR